jgi:hypothetical protein
MPSLLQSTLHSIGLHSSFRTRRIRRVLRAPEFASGAIKRLDMSPVDTMLECFVAVAHYHGVDLSVEGIKHDYALTQHDAIDRVLPSIARRSGFRTKKVKITWRDLNRLGEALPIIGDACLATGHNLWRIFGPKVSCLFSGRRFSPILQRVPKAKPPYLIYATLAASAYIRSGLRPYQNPSCNIARVEGAPRRVGPIFKTACCSHVYSRSPSTLDRVCFIYFVIGELRSAGCRRGCWLKSAPHDGTCRYQAGLQITPQGDQQLACHGHDRDAANAAFGSADALAKPDT